MISLGKLKERKLVQWALAYLAGAWLLLQLVTLLAGMYGWPPAFMRFVPVVLVVGFCAALVLAWYHGEKGEQRVGTVELGMLTALLVIAGGVIALVGNDDPAEATASTPASASVAEQGSIAVLPFADMSAAGDQEYFTDGLTEELLNVLAQLPELRVAARTSSFSFKGTNVPVDSIGRALNVRHVLEGSVRKSGDQIRITAQLIDTETGYHLWSDTYDRDLADIFAVQDEISRAIVDALQIELGGGRERPLVEQETTVPEAHTLVLRGVHARAQGTRESTTQAERFFREALALDPEYARARAGLASTYRYEAYLHMILPEEGYAKAVEEAERALSLDPRQAVAHVVLGQIASERDWDWKAAEAHLRQALESNPNDVHAHSARANLLARLGRAEEAIEAARHAVALDPVSLAALNNLGNVYSYSGQQARAVEQYRATLPLSSGHPFILGNLALTHSDLGQHAEAIAAAEQAMKAAPEDAFTFSTLAYVYARAGQRTEAERTLADLESMPDASPFDVAVAYAGLGDGERVFALLEQAVDKRDGYVTSLGVDPAFDPYRGDPRMRRLLDRMGLP